MGEPTSPTPFGTGKLCIRRTGGGLLAASPLMHLSGIVDYPLDAHWAQRHLVEPGSTWAFQVVFRFAGVTSATGGLSATFAE